LVDQAALDGNGRVNLRLIAQAVKTYCRIHFPYDGMEEATLERLKTSYDEQKAQLLMSSTYTDWGDIDA
jgi:hypothetical protein